MAPTLFACHGGLDSWMFIWHTPLCKPVPAGGCLARGQFVHDCLFRWDVSFFVAWDCRVFGILAPGHWIPTALQVTGATETTGTHCQVLQGLWGKVELPGQVMAVLWYWVRSAGVESPKTFRFGSASSHFAVLDVTQPPWFRVSSSEHRDGALPL